MYLLSDGVAKEGENELEIRYTTTLANREWVRPKSWRTVMIHTTKVVTILVAVVCLVLVPCTHGSEGEIASRDQAQNIPAWFKEGKFGMFIHWGPIPSSGGNGKDIELNRGI